MRQSNNPEHLFHAIFSVAVLSPPQTAAIAPNVKSRGHKGQIADDRSNGVRIVHERFKAAIANATARFRLWREAILAFDGKRRVARQTSQFDLPPSVVPSITPADAPRDDESFRAPRVALGIHASRSRIASGQAEHSFTDYLAPEQLLRASVAMQGDLTSLIERCHTLATHESANVAHRLISSAQILGFPTLARSCQRYEELARSQCCCASVYRDLVCEAWLVRAHLAKRCDPAMQAKD